MAVRAVAVALAGLATAGAAHAVVDQPDVQVATCAAGKFRVAFDPAVRVVVTRGDKRVAAASFTSRIIGGACGEAVRRSAALRTNDDQLGRAISRPVELTCTTASPVRVSVHGILDGDHPGRMLGSSLTLAAGRTTIVAAVLKNKGDRNASRLYRAARFCRF